MYTYDIGTFQMVRLPILEQRPHAAVVALRLVAVDCSYAGVGEQFGRYFCRRLVVVRAVQFQLFQSTTSRDQRERQEEGGEINVKGKGAEKGGAEQRE